MPGLTRRWYGALPESALPTTTARYDRRPALAVLRPVVSSGAMSAAASDTLHAARELEAVGIECGRIASERPPRSGRCVALGVRTAARPLSGYPTAAGQDAGPAAWPSLRDLSGRTR